MNGRWGGAEQGCSVMRPVGVGEGLAERAEPAQREILDFAVPRTQGLFDGTVGRGLQAAASALLEVLRDPLRGRGVVEFAVEVALQHPGGSQAVSHPGHLGKRQQGRLEGHDRIRRGTSPASTRRVRIQARARCNRLITVPRGTPMARAASA